MRLGPICVRHCINTDSPYPEGLTVKLDITDGGGWETKAERGKILMRGKEQAKAGKEQVKEYY